MFVIYMSIMFISWIIIIIMIITIIIIIIRTGSKHSVAETGDVMDDRLSAAAVEVAPVM